MPFYKNWGVALLAIWFVTFFVNWAVYDGDPFGLIFLELTATAAWLTAWAGWSVLVRCRRSQDARAYHPGQMPVHLWIVTGLAVIWYGMAASAYVFKQTGIDVSHGVSHHPPYPAWVDAAWAFGVWGGLVASLLLPIRGRYALKAFGVSAAGLLVEALYARPTWQTTAAPSFLVFQSVVVATLLLFYAWRMQLREALG